jgi:hypothetical protein
VSKVPAPPGFYFDTLDRDVDWQKVAAARPKDIQNDGDVKGLLSFLQDLALGDVIPAGGSLGPCPYLALCRRCDFEHVLCVCACVMSVSRGLVTVSVVCDS